MAPVFYIGRTTEQVDGLPTEVRGRLEWALDSLDRDPENLPNDENRGVETKAMEGPPGLFRIAVRSSRDNPGYRAVCLREADGTILVLRVVRRDANTYVGLRRALRLVGDLSSSRTNKGR